MNSSLKVAAFGLTATLATLSLGGSLQAADTINDLRLAVGIAPDYETDGGGDTDAGTRIGLEYFRSFGDPQWDGRWIWGAELSDVESDDNGSEISQWALTGFLGLAYWLQGIPQIHFEGTPFFGIGSEKIDSGVSDDSDTYTEWGIRAAGFYTFESKWQAGLDLRYSNGTASIEDTDIDNAGLAASIVGGYRF